MCNIVLEGTRGVVDMSKCPFEFASAEFLNFHLKDLSTIEEPIKTLRYEEEIIVELDEEKTYILVEYASVIKQIEGIMLNKEVYGLEQDENYAKRKEAIRKFYEFIFMNPLMAEKILKDYKEPAAERSVFAKGQQNFKAWINGIMKRFTETHLFQLTKEVGDLRAAFLSLAGLRTMGFVSSLLLEIPQNAKTLATPDAKYDLRYGVSTQIYEIPGGEAYLYVQENKGINELPAELSAMMKTLIEAQMKETFPEEQFDILYQLKTREYRQYFLDDAIKKGIEITPHQALIMGREVANWIVGLGSPIENLALDNENITDIYIDSENSPLYIEHAKFGICHTLYRYSRPLLERAFRNIVLSEKGRKFDDMNPVVDVVVKRHSMRTHLQRPPATFGPLVGALRIMQEAPFTYPQYLYFKSFNPFFAGYDDVMVGLGCSEAVLGLKGVGKTAFTAAKITAIGTKKRIIPIQDIQEIPVSAFRKRGFHIGAAKVKSGIDEGPTYKPTGELDLVQMANALLRMGDAALVINEIRSRSAVQGVINLLNTQPGVFLLYNLHAESLKDVQDRLELVFGIPSASMFATDRYTFLKKLRFGRKGRVYRVLGYEYESDPANRQFVEVFKYRRGPTIDTCSLEPKFIKNPEATMWDFDKVDMGKLQGHLDLQFIPPVLVRRSEESGIAPEQYILQAFLKGKMYYKAYKMSVDTNDKLLREIDFVVKLNTATNRMLADLEQENGTVDYKVAQARLEEIFKEQYRAEIASRTA
ncbi:Flp pilus assembly complex ATPase component TadA [Candidatus Micrarchaeota archaeon]|nr:Flp pilus assembly complex ATPase component TadA [Candidatus Micrarchaeota archaeon]